MVEKLEMKYLQQARNLTITNFLNMKDYYILNNKLEIVKLLWPLEEILESLKVPLINKLDIPNFRKHTVKRN